MTALSKLACGVTHFSVGKSCHQCTAEGMDGRGWGKGIVAAGEGNYTQPRNYSILEAGVLIIISRGILTM